MRQTIVGVFDRHSTAQQAVQALSDSGFGPDAVQVTEGDDSAIGRNGAGERRSDEGVTDKIRHFFAGLFGSNDDEVKQYSEAVRRGYAIVKVDVEEDDKLDVAREALASAGALDIDEQPSRLSGETEEGVIPVVREEMQVGKHAVKSGGVRVYAHTVERPVEETVTLREERAHVERRPVDREVTAQDIERAQDATIEVQETTERPVVQKTARVVEEVEVSKDVQEHTETVSDTVRETEVEVEPLADDTQSGKQTKR